ncbi:MAG: glycosyltransferase family 1 protein [Thermoanaerobaculia bacterium]
MPPGEQKPTIAVDTRSLVGPATGIGVFTLSMLKALTDRGVVRCIGMAHRDLSCAEELHREGIEMEAQAAPSGVWWQQLTLPRRLADSDIDLLWSPLLTLPVRNPVPGVVTIHDLTPLVLPGAHQLKVRLSFLPFLASTLRQARRVAVDSKATAEDVKAHYPPAANRLQVVYPGIDPVFVPGAPEDIAATREELSCPLGYLLFSGTLEPRKNLSTLLDAWEALVKTSPDALPIVITGPYGWKSKGLSSRMRKLEALGLHYLGRLPRARQVQVMQAASIFVYPSLYEGFGLPAAEAMACGIPTIVSNRSSLPEVVGDAGLQIEPDDARQLREAIARIADDDGLSSELGERGQQRARRFTWQKAAGEMEEIFLEILAGNHNTAPR